MDDSISRQAAIDIVMHYGKRIPTYAIACKDGIEKLPSVQPEQKSCKTCHLWEDGEINIACPWGSNYEHYEDDYCSLWEKEN